jgi:two-component system OmpR family response regulator
VTTAVTILITDESPALRELAREVLISHGHDVADAATGSQALELADRVQPAVIVIGAELRGPTGDGALEALRGRDSTRHTPVILLTGAATVAGVTDGLAHGAHDYLRRPKWTWSPGPTC